MNNPFKLVWLKCIIVLLLIAGISGGLLAILNDVFYVSPEERTHRAIQKIYGEKKEYSVIIDVDGTDEDKKQPVIYEDMGRIDKIYYVDKTDDADKNFDILFKTTGYFGYKNGTITLWVKVVCSENEQPTIDKIILESFDKQTLMSKLGNSFYEGFYDVTDNYYQAKDKKDEEKTYNPVSGATYSATAACNAVNCVIKFVKGE